MIDGVERVVAKCRTDAPMTGQVANAFVCEREACGGAVS
jgi:hypothetical protein